MLLSIDATKVADQLRMARPTYVVTTCNVEAIAMSAPQPSGISIFSTVVAMPPDLERARARLLTLRQRLIASGESPLSALDLDRQLDETRGRS
jgi:hypothetical protein